MKAGKFKLLAMVTLVGLVGSLGIPCASAQSGGAPLPSRVMLRGDVPDMQVLDLKGQRRNDMLQVQAELYNNSNNDMQIYYRFRWLDENGFQIGDGEVWKPVVILGKQSLIMKGAALSPKAADFRLELSAHMK